MESQALGLGDSIISSKRVIFLFDKIIINVF